MSERPVHDRRPVRATLAPVTPAGAAPTRVATVITRLEGGAGTLALRGAMAMDRDAFAMTIITGSGDALTDQARAAGIEVLFEPTLRRPIDPRSDLAATARLTALFTDRKFDVVHTHTSKAGVVGRVAARRAGVRRIVHTYHGFPFHEFQSAVRRSAYVAAERRLGRCTDVVLCVGAAVAAEAARRRLAPPWRIRAIGVVVDGPAAMNATMSARSALARARARAALGLPDRATAVVGVVGRLARQKEPEDFLTAMAMLGRPGAVGVWVGSGELAGRIARLTSRPAGPRVMLAGERADVLEVLPAFDVFALPSRYEGLPTAIVEAMICGVPVVASAVNAVCDLVIPGETGLLVAPRRPDQLAAAIGYLLDSPEAASQMAAAACARISGKYTEAALRTSLTSAYLPGAEASHVVGAG
jgi:glycosyltransferase involved in cell wall biosynthesis